MGRGLTSPHRPRRPLIRTRNCSKLRRSDWQSYRTFDHNSAKANVIWKTVGKVGITFCLPGGGEGCIFDKLGSQKSGQEGHEAGCSGCRRQNEVSASGWSVV